MLIYNVKSYNHSTTHQDRTQVINFNLLSQYTRMWASSSPNKFVFLASFLELAPSHARGLEIDIKIIPLDIALHSIGCLG